MNNQQKHAPKYWVLHNIEEDDVIIRSASKCLYLLQRRCTERIGF